MGNRESAVPANRMTSEPAVLSRTQARRDWRSFRDVPTTACLAVTMAYVVSTSLRMVARHAAHVPYWDRWQELLPERYLRSPFAQHNEHRIFIGRLFFAVDTWLFGGREWFCEIGTLAMLAATAVLVASGAARERSPRRVFVPVLALGVTLLMSAYSWENLLWGFQVSFVGVLPFAVGAFVAMGSAGRDNRRFAIAIACAVAAACSLSSGVLVAPLLVAYAALTGRARRDVAVSSLVTVLVFAGYLAGYDAPHHHANPASSILRPGAVLGYVAACLGAPFTWNVRTDRVALARLFGYAGLVVWIALCGLAFRRRRDSAGWVLPFAMTYAVGTATLTALGRLNFAPTQALESRYASTVFVFWIALAGQLWRYARRGATEVALGALASAAAIGMACSQGFEEGIAAGRLEALRPGETALLAGALEKTTVDRISPAPNLVLDTLPELRKRRLSVFHSGWVSWIGRPIERFVSKRDDGACKGFLDRARAVPSYGGPAFRVEGWAVAVESGMAPKRIVLIDESGTVLGFALTGVERTDVPRALSGVHDRFTGFEGHIGALAAGTVRVTAVALLEGRVACWLNGSLSLREADAVALIAN